MKYPVYNEKKQPFDFTIYILERELCMNKSKWCLAPSSSESEHFLHLIKAVDIMH